MDPQTVLRFVKTVHGWPGKVVVVGCEPAEVEEMGIELSEPVRAAVERAAGVVLEELEQAAIGCGVRGGLSRCTSSPWPPAIVETVVKHAEGAGSTSVQMRIGALRQVVPESLVFYFGICSRDTRLRRRRA